MRFPLFSSSPETCPKFSQLLRICGTAILKSTEFAVFEAKNIAISGVLEGLKAVPRCYVVISYGLVLNNNPIDAFLYYSLYGINFAIGSRSLDFLKWLSMVNAKGVSILLHPESGKLSSRSPVCRQIASISCNCASNMKKGAQSTVHVADKILSYAFRIRTHREITQEQRVHLTFMEMLKEKTISQTLMSYSKTVAADHIAVSLTIAVGYGCAVTTLNAPYLALVVMQALVANTVFMARQHFLEVLISGETPAIEPSINDFRMKVAYHIMNFHAFVKDYILQCKTDEDFILVYIQNRNDLVMEKDLAINQFKALPKWENGHVIYSTNEFRQFYKNLYNKK